MNTIKSFVDKHKGKLIAQQHALKKSIILIVLLIIIYLTMVKYTLLINIKYLWRAIIKL